VVAFLDTKFLGAYSSLVASYLLECYFMCGLRVQAESSTLVYSKSAVWKCGISKMHKRFDNGSVVKIASSWGLFLHFPKGLAAEVVLC
jgi:hypothetical protein